MRGTTRYTLTLHCIYICIDFFFYTIVEKKIQERKEKILIQVCSSVKSVAQTVRRCDQTLSSIEGFFFSFGASHIQATNKQGTQTWFSWMGGGVFMTQPPFRVSRFVSVSITNHNALFWWMYMLQTRTHMHSHTPSFQLDFLDHMPWLYQYIKQQTHQHKVWSCFNVGQLSVRLLLNCDTCVNVMWGRGEPGPELLYEMNVSVSSH